MTDIPTPGQSVKKVRELHESLPEPPTYRQLKEAEMERDTAFASAERNAVRVESLRAELKRVSAKALREKEKLAGKLKTEVLSWQIRAEDAEAELVDLQDQIRRDAPLMSVVQAHANKEEPTKGCSCPVCQVHRLRFSVIKELVEAKKKYREAKETLKSFQGPPSKRKRKMKGKHA